MGGGGNSNDNISVNILEPSSPRKSYLTYYSMVHQELEKQGMK